MKKHDKKRVIGFNESYSIIRVQLRGGKGEKYHVSGSFTIRLKGKVTDEQVEDLRDFLLEAAKDWYKETQ